METPDLKVVMTALGYPDIDVRFVGGCVRDALLGRPVTDIDLATPDLPATVMEKLTSAGLEAVPTGLDHGTVTAVCAGRGFEVTTLRRDTACDGRHAAVEFTTDWEEDASRRDFTMNAMSARSDGTVFDPFTGADDARAGIVRFVGNPRDRIQEDYLRILRYFRFLAHYGRGGPDKEILAACHDLRDGLTKISAERVRDELTKLLNATDPMVAADAMMQAGISRIVLPDALPTTVLKRLVALEKEMNHREGKACWQRRLLCLLPMDSDIIRAAVKCLKVSNKDIKSIENLAQSSQQAPIAVDQTNRARFLYASQNIAAEDAVLIAWARKSTPERDKWKTLYEETKVWVPVTFPLKGADVQALGVPEGPQVGAFLAQLETEWIDGGCQASVEDLRRRLKSLVF